MTVAAPVVKPCARKSRRVTGFLCEPCFSGSSRPRARLRCDLMMNMRIASYSNQGRGAAERGTAGSLDHIRRTLVQLHGVAVRATLPSAGCGSSIGKSLVRATAIDRYAVRHLGSRLRCRAPPGAVGVPPHSPLALRGAVKSRVSKLNRRPGRTRRAATRRIHHHVAVLQGQLRHRGLMRWTDNPGGHAPPAATDARCRTIASPRRCSDRHAGDRRHASR